MKMCARCQINAVTNGTSLCNDCYEIHNQIHGIGSTSRSHRHTKTSKTDYEYVQPVKTTEWLVTLLILMIPLINVVMMFVWAFGGGANPSKANFFKAQIIMLLIGAILWILFLGAIIQSILQ